MSQVAATAALPLAMSGRPRFQVRYVPWLPLALLGFFAVAATVGPYIAPHPIDTVSLLDATRRPVFFGGTWSHPLGTDQLGRDLLSLLIRGARPSLIISLSAVAAAGSLGTVIGMLAGHFRGKIDVLLSRLIDMTMAIPALLLVILLSASLRPGMTTVVIALSAVAWVPYARVVRAESLSITQRDYVTSARAAGATELRLVFRHILPNISNSVIVLSTVQIGSLIIAEASLSFLGLGIQPPNTSWGLIVAGGRNYVSSAWWLTVLPGVAIMITVLGFNLLGNWLSERLDPVRRGR